MASSPNRRELRAVVSLLIILSICLCIMAIVRCKEVSSVSEAVPTTLVIEHINPSDSVVNGEKAKSKSASEKKKTKRSSSKDKNPKFQPVDNPSPIDTPVPEIQ